MKFFRTTLYSGVIAVLRLSVGFVSTKIIAMIIGTAGVATVGSFANLITIVLSFGNGAIANGVIKYVAENNKDKSKETLIIDNALKIAVICGLFFGSIIFFLAGNFSILIFRHTEYINTIRALGITLIFYSLNSIILAILNGQGKINKFTLVNTVSSIVSLLVTCILVFFFKIKGALYAMVLSQTIIFFITLTFVFKEDWLSLRFLKTKLDNDIIKSFSHFSLMALITAVTIPISQIWLRNLVTETFSLHEAGLWQGLMRISDAYLMIVSLTLSTYYLPKLSSLNDPFEIKKEILKGYLIILPFVLVTCVVIYVCRIFIIDLLYTPSFRPMANLFFWQLLGDFFKIMSYLLAFLMLAKRRTTLYIVTEILFSALYVFFGYFFTSEFGFQGITIAFASTYFIYLIIMILAFKKFLKRTEKI